MGDSASMRQECARVGALRRGVQQLKKSWREETMAAYQPDGWRTVTPRIFTDDVRGLTSFMRAVFGATGRAQAGRPMEMRIGDSIVMVSGDEVREVLKACLYVYVEDTDKTYRKAMAAGARAIEKPLDTPYGDRRAVVEDAWGNVWQIATRQAAKAVRAIRVRAG
jgi:PhnB protein